MKILLISDFGLHHTVGGAQRSNQLIVDEGIKRGHDISVFHYDGDISLFQGDYDWVISSNLEAISQIIGNVVDWLDGQTNHIRLEHDMNRYLSNDKRFLLWRNCKASFFLTKFHYECFRKNYGDYFVNLEFVPDPIDRSFCNRFGKREDCILYSGFMHPLKGTHEFFDLAERNPDKKFLVAGWGPGFEERVKLKNVSFLGQVDHFQMVDLYNSVRGWYHMPPIYEPFCRSAGEAMVCGVPEMLTNGIIGARHMYDEDPDGFAEACYNAASTFWEKVECL